MNLFKIYNCKTNDDFYLIGDQETNIDLDEPCFIIKDRGVITPEEIEVLYKFKILY